MSNFDADALERAAKYARELEKTPNLKAVLELSKREQKLKSQELSKQQAKYEKEAASYKVSQEKVRWEEQRKTISHNKQVQLVRLYFYLEFGRCRRGTVVR
jgi:ATPase family AAA domain-containing protein 3A/B